jgi:hypothetical protein
MLSMMIAAALGMGAPAETAGAKAAPSPDADKKICKFDRDLGSRIGLRRCMTRAEWDSLAKESAELMRRRRDLVTTPGT